MRVTRRTRSFLAGLVMAALAATVAGEAMPQEPAPFTLEGEAIRIILPSSAGGMSDTQTRLLIQYLGQYLPGSPNFVVQNIDGAGGQRMLEYLNSLDPADNYIVFTSPSAMPFRARAGFVDPALFDPRSVNWVGSFRGSTLFCLVRTDTGIETLDDLRRQPVNFGATSISGNDYAILSLLNDQLGLQLQPVLGYQSTGEIALALDRGEVQGVCNNYAIYKQYLQTMVNDGRARLLFYMGPEPRADVAAPYLFDLAMDDEARAFIRSAIGAISFAGPYAIPAGSDPAFVEAFRRAFDATMADPGFIAAAETAGIDLAYIDGPTIAANVEALYQTPDEVIRQIGALFFGD